MATMARSTAQLPQRERSTEPQVSTGQPIIFPVEPTYPISSSPHPSHLLIARGFISRVIQVAGRILFRIPETLLRGMVFGLMELPQFLVSPRTISLVLAFQ